MKKVFIWILILVLIAAVSVNIWLFYKREASFKVQIPAQTQGLMRINTERIIKKNIFSDLRDSVKSSTGYGLNIPLNIFVYNFSHDEKEGWASVFKIIEPQKFQTFLNKYFTEKTGADIEGVEVYKTSKAPIYCITQHDKAIFAYAKNDSIGYWINELLAENNFIDLSESKFAKIKKESDDLFVMLNNKELSVNFQKGLIRTALLLDNINTQIDTAYSPATDTSAAALLAYKGKLPNDLMQYFIKDRANISIDSIALHLRPGLYFQSKGGTPQWVKKVAYEYDDNFEKKETATSELRQVPLSFLEMNADSTLCDYLTKNKMLIEDSVDREAFPLYALYGKCSTNSFLLSTAKDYIPQRSVSSFIPNKKVLKGYIDFTKMHDAAEWSAWHSYLVHLQHIEALGSIEDKQLLIDAKLRLTEQDTNAFATLYKALLTILR